MSVVEVIVALMLVSIGLLGLAGSTTIALRTTNDVLRRRTALHDVKRRLALLESGGCRNEAGSFSDPIGKSSERWRIGVTGSFAFASDTVTWPSARGPVTLHLDTAFPC
jgi:hypothetical protein